MKRGTGNPWRRLGLPAHVGWLVVAVYSVAAVLIAASSVFGWEGVYATRPVDELVTVLCLVFAAVCAGRAARAAVGRRRLGWLALVTALLGWAVGEVIWAVYEARPELEHATHPAAAEIVLLLYPVGAMASLVLLANRIRNHSRQLVLDGAHHGDFAVRGLVGIRPRQTVARGQRLAARDASARFRRCHPHDNGDPDVVAESSFRPAEPGHASQRNHDDRRCRHRRWCFRPG